MQQSDVLGRRIGAAIIDIGIVFVLLLLLGSLIGSEVGPDAPDSTRFSDLDRLAILCLVFGYYWIPEALWGRTAGKRVLDIRVERVDGSKAGFGATFVRTLVLVLIDWLVGLIVVLVTGERRARLGDLAAKTRVVAAHGRPGDDQPKPPPPPPPPSDEDVLTQIMR